MNTHGVHSPAPLCPKRPWARVTKEELAVHNRGSLSSLFFAPRFLFATNACVSGPSSPGSSPVCSCAGGASGGSGSNQAADGDMDLAGGDRCTYCSPSSLTRAGLLASFAALECRLRCLLLPSLALALASRVLTLLPPTALLLWTQDTDKTAPCPARHLPRHATQHAAGTGFVRAFVSGCIRGEPLDIPAGRLRVGLIANGFGGKDALCGAESSRCRPGHGTGRSTPPAPPKRDGSPAALGQPAWR